MKASVLYSLVILLFCSMSLDAQEIKSVKSRLHINNIPAPEPEPDTEAPALELISPPIKAGATFQVGKSEINLVGRISDEGRITLSSLNSELVTLNESGVFNTLVSFQPGINNFKLLAMDEANNLAELSFSIDYQPPEPTLAEKITEVSTYYALIIGINQYKDSEIPDLDRPISDAKELYNTLLEQYEFKESNMRFIKNATRADLIQSLDEMSSMVSQDDNLLIFYAGHGWWDADANNGYWLPSDADKTVKTNWFRNSTLVDYLKEINSRHTLLITDACFGGAIFSTRNAFGNKEKAYEKLYDLPSRKAMTSGNYTEVPDLSSFSKYLIRRLSENSDPYLSSEQLFSSFRIAVINNSDAIPQYGEIKNVGDEGGDFIFLKKKE